MTTILGLLLSFSLLSTPSVKTAIENQVSNGQIERVAADEDTFVVQNQTTLNVGTVTIHEVDQSSAQINVTGAGTFKTEINSAAAACELNGQVLPQGVPVRVMIDAHTTVRATWTSDIIVIDQDEKM